MDDRDVEGYYFYKPLVDTDGGAGRVILFPAIDLADGQCVRLLRGDMEQATVYNPQPADQAARFRDAGCRWIHVVDLDGAFSGRSVNGDAVEAVISAGGPGAARRRDPHHGCDRGLARTRRCPGGARDPRRYATPDLVRESCRAFPGRIAVGIDARAGMAAAQGWSETTEIRGRRPRPALRGLRGLRR